MKGKDFSAWGKKLCAMFGKYKFVFLVILAGITLLLLPSFGADKTVHAGSSAVAQDTFNVGVTEQKLEEALSRVVGAGPVTVVLTVKNGARQILAQDGKKTEKEGASDEEETTVVVSRGAGMQETVAIESVAPQYRGALVVCAGGDDPAIRLMLVEAVSALTGLGSDKISICKGK